MERPIRGADVDLARPDGFLQLRNRRAVLCQQPGGLADQPRADAKRPGRLLLRETIMHMCGMVPAELVVFALPVSPRPGPCGQLRSGQRQVVLAQVPVLPVHGHQESRRVDIVPAAPHSGG